jgi:hypothetical protein
MVGMDRVEVQAKQERNAKLIVIMLSKRYEGATPTCLCARNTLFGNILDS